MFRRLSMGAAGSVLWGKQDAKLALSAMIIEARDKIDGA